MVEAPGEPTVQVTLWLCGLKADKFEWVLQKATELGVAVVVPVVSSRTVVRPAAALERKRARWEVILREAAEQCGRGRLPVLGAACDLPAALAQEQAGVRLVAWEEAAGSPGMIHALTHVPLPVRDVHLLIGPEGGLEADEIAQAECCGMADCVTGTTHLARRDCRVDGAGDGDGRTGRTGGCATHVGKPTVA